MANNNEIIVRKYRCSVCKNEHTIKLNKNICLNRNQYPFPYIFLHGALKNILTTLYIDRNCFIRAVDVKLLSDDDLFSKQQVIKITNELINEIEKLRKENNDLTEQIKKLKG